MEELARGALDAVLLALPVSEPDIETHALFDDPFLLAVPASDPRPATARASTRATSIRPADPAGGRSLPARSGAGVLRRARGAARASGLGATSLATVMQMVANGYGVTLLPRSRVDVEVRDERVKLLRFAQPEPARTDRAGVAPHFAAQGGLRGARQDRHRGARA